MRRLSVIDGIFLRTHRGMGTPIALQGLWRTADPVDPARLDLLRDALRLGSLGRRVVRPGVPGARGRWQISTRAHPLDVASAPLRVAEILPWADRRGVCLDPRGGLGWRLSVAPLTDGGTVVALTCSHVLADARGLVMAVEEALWALDGNGMNPEPVPGHDRRPSGTAKPIGDPESDWVDAAETWATVLTGTVRAARSTFRRARPAEHFRLRRRLRERRAGTRLLEIPALTPGDSWSAKENRPGEVRPAHGSLETESSGAPAGASSGSSGSGSSGSGAECSAVINRDASEPRNRVTGRGLRYSWRRSRNAGSAPRALGSGARGRARAIGSGNRGGGRAPRADTAVAHAELPVPALVLRCPGPEWDRVAVASGGTANSLFIWLVANTLWTTGFPEREIVASLPVDTRHESRIDNDLAMTEIVVAPDDDPGEIRAKSRAAYERRISSPGGLPEEFLHLVPDRVAYLLSRGAGERDILCSNIGPIPAPLHALGPHDCTGVAARAIHPGLTYARRPRTRLSGYLCRFRGDYLLTLASLDPARVPDATELHRLAADTARRIGLPMVPW